MHPLPDLVAIEFILSGSLGQSRRPAALLDALNAVGLPPSTWGTEDGEKRPVDRDQILAYLEQVDGTPSFFGLRRAGSCRYELFTSLDQRSVNAMYLNLEKIPSTKKLRQVFDLFRELCTLYDPEYAFIHPVWYQPDDSDRADIQVYSASGSLRLEQYAKLGPSPITAQTWLGARVVDLLGRTLLERSGVQIEQDGLSGSMLVSLLPDPWARGLEELMVAQQQVMSALQPSGVFGQYVGKYWLAEAGARWKPIDLKWSDGGMVQLHHTAQ